MTEAMTDDDIETDELEDEQPRVPHFIVEDDEDATDEEAEDGRFPFTLGRKDEPVEGARVLYARRPKTSILMQFGQVDPKTTDFVEITRVINLFLDSVLEKPSREYVRGRLNDPDDTWDVDILIPVINRLKATWYGRPTGRATGSSGSPNSRGNRSTGRSRSRGKTRRR